MPKYTAGFLFSYHQFRTCHLGNRPVASHVPSQVVVDLELKDLFLQASLTFTANDHCYRFAAADSLLTIYIIYKAMRNGLQRSAGFQQFRIFAYKSRHTRRFCRKK